MSVIDIHKGYNPRLRIFYYIIGAMIIVLLGGLARLQLLSSATYSEREQRQNQRLVQFPGPRGNIFDREGRLLVGNQPRFSAVIYLAELRPEFRREYLSLMRQYRALEAELIANIPEKEQAQFLREFRRGRHAALEARINVVQRYLDQINEVTGREQQVDPQDLDRHFRQRLLLPYPLVGDLHRDEYARILELIPIDSKIQLHTVSARYYPHGSAAAHVLGYVSSTYELPQVDLPGDGLMTFNIPGSTGRTGIERFFNDRLQGQTGGEIWVVDPSGFRYGTPVQRQLPVKGENIITSIDLDIQKVAEQAIGPLRTGAVVAMDVRTGEVLALATSPSYDLNDLTPFIPRTVFQRIDEEGGWLNRAVQGLYPPGSTFKLITATAALRAGAITPDTVSHCHGSYRVGSRNFPCHSRAGHGKVDLIESIRISCNVFYYEHSLPTSIEAIAAEARLFGLHEKTGIEIPFETGGMIVPDREYKRRAWGEPWYPGDTANVSIGQGFLRVTPLQMAAFTASLARGETSTTPTVLRRGAGQTIHPNAQPIGLPQGYIDALIAGMEAAVQNGTARFARMSEVRVAGKTGTAQVPSPQGTLHLAWFVGFAPVEDPRIAIAVMIEGTHVDDRYAGGTTAAPVAREVLEKYFEKNPPPPADVAASSP